MKERGKEVFIDSRWEKKKGSNPARSHPFEWMKSKGWIRSSELNCMLYITAAMFPKD